MVPLCPPASPYFGYSPSGFTGSTARPKVELVTAAKEAYQTAIAVTRGPSLRVLLPQLLIPSLGHQNQETGGDLLA